MLIAHMDGLVDAHGKMLFSFCLRLAGNRADAEDLYQDTFLKAAELCERIDPEGNAGGYLAGIAVRLWKNKYRKDIRRQRIAPTMDFADAESFLPGAQAPEDILVASETGRALRAAAEALNDKLRIPFYMMYTADMSIEEIGRALRLPIGTVKSRLSRARQRIREGWADYHA